MTNVEHSTITDPNIHEPKGIASATNTYVYVANGGGSGVWTDPTTLIPIPSPFGAFLHVYSTVNNMPGTSSINTWQTPNSINSSVNTISGSTVSTNTISLPAGTYYVDASMDDLQPDTSPAAAIWAVTQSVTTRIYNVTDSAELISAVGYTGADITGTFTLAATKTVRFDYYPSSATVVGGGPVPNWIINNSNNPATNHVVGISFWKLS